MTIVLYDVPSTFPGRAWNFNAWKTRLSLNFKRIPYTTQWVEFPDIEPLYKKLGIPPSKNKADGTPFYTIPAIHDPSTGAYITDSILIAEYLDKTYPDSPRIIPDGTLGVQSAFNDGVFYNLKTLIPVVFPVFITKLSPRSADYMLATLGRGLLDGPGSDAFEQWNTLLFGLQQVDGWFLRNGGKGLYLLGNVPSWADIVVASLFLCLRLTFGENSTQWKQLMAINDGRWKGRIDVYRAWENSP
ncbi:Glutathione S-transferase-like protein ustS [Psilocybe cubensis]|uniref:GST N-terminal domain-containing protein n=2 Tax=Psilocybe cubensis TaxID=181762 RepID=A0A8H7XST6_PSICU|nr:Glutathione S-transferase-like protein ustS [Psilocybe cubensis]KAH9480875.1 Glutathione S-transferase-like protein ustS [Psilocybe cubensis]